MAKLPGLTVFFPCYNEEPNVEPLVRRCLEFLPQFAEIFEVIVVNDHSKDKTGEIADRLAGEDSHVRVVHHPENRGYGGALQSGFAAATLPYVFFMDGDGQFDIADLGPFVGSILAGGVDAAVGYRVNRQDPLHRRLNAFCWGTLVNILFGLGIKDVDCAYKLISRDKLKGMVLKSNGALISTELLARLKKKGARFSQLPVKHYPRKAGIQTGAKLSVILRAFKELFKFYRELKKEA